MQGTVHLPNASNICDLPSWLVTVAGTTNTTLHFVKQLLFIFSNNTILLFLFQCNHLPILVQLN